MRQLLRWPLVMADLGKLMYNVSYHPTFLFCYYYHSCRALFPFFFFGKNHVLMAFCC